MEILILGRTVDATSTADTGCTNVNCPILQCPILMGGCDIYNIANINLSNRTSRLLEILQILQILQRNNLPIDIINSVEYTKH